MEQAEKGERERYPVRWSDLGAVEYEWALAEQKRLAAGVYDEGPGYILFLSHPPTITLGYSLKGDEGRSEIKSTPSELAAAGIRVIQSDRGGKATYHGPGQLVCYLILSLKMLKLGVKRYVGKLQNVALSALRDLGLPAELDAAYPGVWVNGAKLAAVGIRVEDRVTAHGFAINVNPDLAMFRHLVPCGISDRPVTSLAALGVAIPDRTDLIGLLLTHLEREFRLALTERKELDERAGEGTRPPK